MRSWLVNIGLFVIAIVMVGGIALLWDANTPKSTHGVEVVAGNTARVAQGETFVLTHLINKVTHVWLITYDGAETVKLDDTTLFGDHHTVTLCGVDCEVDVNMGRGDHFYISLRQDGAVNVKWPWGWNFR